jgi:hypothetical protein
MRVVREQMLCIISPNWSGDVNDMTDAKVQKNLRQLLDSLDIVHFASIALLPNQSDDERQDMRPSLMLELTVDEGIVPIEVLKRLTSISGSVLWDSYKNFYTGTNFLTNSEKNAWLLNHFLQGLSVADGAFLGPRDRNVKQILQERELYKSAQKYAQSLPLWDKQERAEFALKMVRWAEQTPSFDWARVPAPRSFWRTKSLAGKIGFLFKLMMMGFVLLWLLHGVLKCLKWVVACLEASQSNTILQNLDAKLGSMLQIFPMAFEMCSRLVMVLFFAIVGFSIIFMLLPTLLPPWRRWLNALKTEIERPSQTWSSHVTTLYAWVLVVALLFVFGLSIMFVLQGVQAIASIVNGLQLPQQWWLIALFKIYVALFVASIVLLIFGLRTQYSSTGSFANPIAHRSRFQRWFQQPFDDETPAALQVHESVEVCESELVGNTAHMISLTDLLGPVWWNRMMAWLSLRVVTILGYTHFTEGRLSGAPGIQYSHWHLIDGGRRMLFCANFDGTFGGYLDDFIKGPSAGVNMFWRWTHLKKRRSAIDGHPAVTSDRRFPPTRLWFFRGVKCELKFKAYARESMLPHLFRYEATNLSMEQKNRATAFRNALFGERTNANDDLIMRVLET